MPFVKIKLEDRVTYLNSRHIHEVRASSSNECFIIFSDGQPVLTVPASAGSVVSAIEGAESKVRNVRVEGTVTTRKTYSNGPGW